MLVLLEHAGVKLLIDPFMTGNQLASKTVEEVERTTFSSPTVMATTGIPAIAKNRSYRLRSGEFAEGPMAGRE